MWIPIHAGQAFVQVEYAAIMRADLLVAFAGRLPDLLQIDDMNVPAAVADHSSSFQAPRNLRHAGSSDAHHLSKELLCQRKIDAGKIVHTQQPPASACLNSVNRIAGCCLLPLCQKKLFVLEQQASENW